MKRMLPMAVVLTSCVLLPAAAWAQPFSVEIDLDNSVGNGPDLVCYSVSDYVTADIWITGQGAGILSLGVTICNYYGSLEFQGASYAIPVPPWTETPPSLQGPCVLMQATDFTFTQPILAPFLFATTTWHAAVDNIVDDLDIDAAQSGYLDTSFNSGMFTNNVGGTVAIGVHAATEETSWGSVKSLFR